MALPTTSSSSSLRIVSQRRTVGWFLTLALLWTVGSQVEAFSHSTKQKGSALSDRVGARGWYGSTFASPNSEPTVRLFATIFNPDGGREEDYSMSSSSSSSSYVAPSSPLNDPFGSSNSAMHLVETLSQNNQDSLARLAVAFSRQDHGFSMSDIESVHILAIDNSQITLSVVLCDNMGCVTVAIPVQFPNPCTAPPPPSTTDDSCILDNVYQLDTQAKVVIDTLEWQQANHEELAHTERVQVELSSEDKLSEYPSWWVDAGFFLQEECASMKLLLNSNDFQMEIRSISETHISQQLQAQQHNEFASDDQAVGSTNSAFDVEQAGVALVGPAGMVVRAQVKHMALYDQNDWVTTYDIPVQFASEATNVGELRARILGVVESTN